MRYVMQALDIHGAEAGVEHTTYRPRKQRIRYKKINESILLGIPKHFFVPAFPPV